MSDETNNTLTLRELLLKLNRVQKLDFAEKCGTSLGYLRKLAYGQCEPSLSMFRKMHAIEPRLTIDSFFTKSSTPAE